MGLRCDRRNRESHPRKGAPTGRPDQSEINRAKLSNLPSWRKKLMKAARAALDEASRRLSHAKKKGWA